MIIMGDGFCLLTFFGFLSFSMVMIVVIWLIAVIYDESWFVNVQRRRSSGVVKVCGGLRTCTVCALYGGDGGVEDVGAVLKSVVDLLLVLLIDEVLNLLLTWWLTVGASSSFH